MRHHGDPSRDAGFTLVELMVAVFVLVVGVLGVVSLLDATNRTTSANRAREGATNLTREIIEDARSVPYGSLEAGSLATTIAGLSGGTAQANGTIAYSRRGVLYTSTPSLCYVDDPKDGYGNHGGSSFCAAAPAAAPVSDTFALDYKRFTVVTTWKAKTGSGISRQTAVINDPGSSFAPQIATFALTSPTSCTGDPACAQIDAAVNTSASFAVTTTRPASKVTWYVNDTKLGTASGSGTGPWTFTWPLTTVLSGTYTVSVRAYSGKDGPVRNLVIPVKDGFAGPPTNPRGGTNQLWTNTVELTWTPVASAVLGYEVDRLVGGVWSPVTCTGGPGDNGTVTYSPRPSGSYCMDKNAAGATQYRIFSVFSLAGTPTRSSSSVTVTIDANVRPCPPNTLAVANSANKLTWNAPTSASGCATSRVRFYRIYRREDSNGSGLPAGTLPTLSERVFATSDATVRQYTDATRTSKTNYWVTAIDDRNAESVVAGPVH